MKFEIKGTDNLQQSLEAIITFIKSKYSEDIKNATVYVTLANTRTKTDEYTVNGTDILKGSEKVFSKDQYELIEKLKTEIGRHKHECYNRIQEIKRQIGLDNLYIDDKRHLKDARDKRIAVRNNHKTELAEAMNVFNELLMPFDVDTAELQFTYDNNETTLVAYSGKCEASIKKTQKGVSDATFKHREK